MTILRFLKKSLNTHKPQSQGPGRPAPARRCVAVPTASRQPPDSALDPHPGPPQVPREGRAGRSESQTSCRPRLVAATPGPKCVLAGGGGRARCEARVELPPRCLDPTRTEVEKSPDVATRYLACPSAPAQGHFPRVQSQQSEAGPSEKQRAWARTGPRRRSFSRLPPQAQRAPPLARSVQPHNTAPHLSEPRPPLPSPPQAGARTRGPAGAPCCAQAEEGARDGPGVRRRARGGTGAPGAPGRPGDRRPETHGLASGGLRRASSADTATVRVRSGTARPGRAAGRGGPAGPGGPAPGPRPGLLTSGSGFLAVSHRPGAGAGVPPPRRARPQV